MTIESVLASRRAQSLLVVLLGVFPQPGFSIDFKIDVPPFREEVLAGGPFEQAQLSAEDSEPAADTDSETVTWQGSALIPGLPAVSEIPAPPLPEVSSDSPQNVDLNNAEQSEMSLGEDVESLAGGIAAVAARDPFEAQLGIYETTAFPVPACLVPNVAFWKKIYRDVKTDEALIHDRDNLNRIFGKLRLPVAKGPRTRSLKLAREHFEQRLERLADKVSDRVTLTVSERDLLNVFEPGFRDAREIRAAAGRLRIQSGLQQRFSGGVRRSLGYLPTITPILKQYGVPKDIVHLPHVESSYVRTAQSKVGAVGLWQIMPETMRRLMGSSAVRKRTHLTVSTHAAAKLLRQNFRMLKSWPLALTAYNHGAAGVSRGIRQTGSRDICTLIAQYNSRSFKFASSNFYAQFLAARHVALDEYKALSQTAAHRRVLQPLLAHASREKL